MDTCGVCDQAVRIVTRPDGGTMWKHVAGAWHRPVLGTPVKEADQLWARLDARRFAEAAESRKVTPVPPSIQRAREVGPDDDIPRGVRTILTLALRNDWATRLTVAIGPWLDAHGAASRTVESYCLKARRPGRAAVAAWVTSSDPLEPPKFECGYILGQDGLTAATSREVRTYLKEV